MLAAIIVAGGSSRRMGFDKTFASLGGKPVIARTIAAFEATAAVDEIILVGREERLEELRVLVTGEGFVKVRAIVAGGIHRQDSVANGLAQLDAKCEFVAVHDAARPLVRPEQITAVFEAARRLGAAALAAPVTDTLKCATKDRVVCGSLEREGVYAMQTPQIFERALLLEAFAAVATKQLPITDEVSAVELLERKVVLVPNDRPNMKITFPADLTLAEILWKAFVE
ncbi:MAG: 2-C-methyl-D-erythritol 4-phosphate cytidylyltransferase [Chthoniobacterales bacterium]